MNENYVKENLLGKKAMVQLPQIIEYIKEQENHHQKRSFLEEYQSFLKLFEVDFEEKYIFKEME